MKKLLIGLMLLVPLRALADCTQTCAVGSATAQCVAATLPTLRHYLLIQNTGVVDAYCAIGSNNQATTTNGIRIPANGGNWELVPYMNPNGVVATLPVGDVSCITAGGNTTIITCDW